MKKVSKTEQDIFLQNVHFIYRGLKNSFGCLFISVNLIAVYYGNSTFAERERERERGYSITNSDKFIKRSKEHRSHNSFSISCQQGENIQKFKILWFYLYIYQSFKPIRLKLSRQDRKNSRFII
jgi:hypothetical protein